jgi:hypothetical protein
MTSEEFVKSRMPKASIERQTTNGGETYYLVRVKRSDTMYFVSGKTKSNAWVNAKKRILEMENKK